MGGVTDAVAGASYPNDIDSGQMPTGNYVYNAIGQLTTNYQENLYYFYNTQGLVTEVRKGTVPIVKFYYNERGQRIKKENFLLYQGQYVANTKTYYSLDLSGNVMAVYNSNFTGSVGSYSSPAQNDLPVYGLSRLGVYSRSGATSYYEITDHLGNVRAVIKKVGGSPVISSYADYYPFGEQLPGRTSSTGYRYAFQGQELDPETGMEAFQLRLWDGRIGRWLSPDPMGQFDSPYLGMGNNPVNLIDPDGGFAGGPGDPPKGWIGRMFSSIGNLFAKEKSNYMGELSEVVVINNYKKPKSNSDGSYYIFSKYVFYDPWPNSKWDWFENNFSSGSKVWGTGGGTEEYGRKLGSNGVLYEPYYMDEWVLPSGGGGKLTFWKHKTNTIPKIVKFIKDYNEAANHGNELGKHFKNADTLYEIHYKTHSGKQVWTDSQYGYKNSDSIINANVKNGNYTSGEAVILNIIKSR